MNRPDPHNEKPGPRRASRAAISVVVIILVMVVAIFVLRQFFPASHPADFHACAEQQFTSLLVVEYAVECAHALSVCHSVRKPPMTGPVTSYRSRGLGAR